MYRWDGMAAEGFVWWTAHLARSLLLVDAVHGSLIGSSRYWKAADAPSGKIGRWCPGPGRVLFDAMATALSTGHTSLPILVEDLALVTPDVVAGVVPLAVEP